MSYWNGNIARIVYGNDEIAKAYYGADVVFQKEQPLPDNYIKSGLVLWLDGYDKGTDNTAWVDKVSGHVFTNNGATFNTDHVYFNGSSNYLTNTSLSIPTSASGTIEVVFEDDATSGSRILFMPKSTSQSLAFGIVHSSNTIIWGIGKSRSKFNAFSSGSVSINYERAYHNGTAMTKNGSDYWGGPNNTTYLGRRSSGNYWNGKAYSIRIYNRQLTQDEVLANLAVDNIRFNLGLTL